MPEVRESSLLFSLDSLFAHERDKIESERREAARKRQAALEAEAQAERARQTERARLAAETRDRLLAEDRRQRDEQARLEGIRQAELDRARLEAHLKSETELAARRERHELELRALALATRSKRNRALLIGGGALACVAALGSVAFALLNQSPELARLRAAGAAARANEEARANELRGMLTDAERRRRELEAEIAARAHAVASAAPAPSATSPGPRPVRPARPVPPTGPRLRPPCGGDANDPLNPCLGG